MKMKIIFKNVTFAIALVTFFACAKKEAEKEKSTIEKDGINQSETKAPVITAEKPEFNFGVVKQGVSVTHVFNITNKGNAPLNIEKARGS